MPTKNSMPDILVWIQKINEIISASAKYQSEEELVKHMINAVIVTLGASYGYCHVFGDDKNLQLLYKTASTTYNPQVPRKNGVISKTIEKKKPSFFYDITFHVSARSDARANMHGCVVIPIHYKNVAYGALVIAFAESKDFTETEKLFCEFICTTLGQAFAMHMLYRDLANFKRTLDNTLDAICIFSKDTFEISYVNQGMVSFVKMTRNELLNSTFLKLVAKSSREMFISQLEKLSTKSIPSVLFEIKLKVSGVVYPAEIFLQEVDMHVKSKQCLVIFRNIVERKKNEAVIRKLALMDSLTRIPNRLAFMQYVEEKKSQKMLENHTAMYVLLDLDKFKFVNDVLGHAAGDSLLIGISKRIKQVLRKSDYIYRLGGDEFVIAFEGVRKQDDAIAVAAKLMNITTEPFVLDGNEIRINFSFGICLFPSQADTVENAIKRADWALYKAKESGGGYQFYENGLELVRNSHFVEKQLKNAINRNELFLEFQPQIDVLTSQIVGLESLVRWRHPEGKVWYPGEFIPIAEKSSLICDLGKWVILESFKTISIWKLEKKKIVPLSINLSARQLIEPGLLQTIQNAMDQYQIKPNEILFEITESLVFKNQDVVLQSLNEIRGLGIDIHLDDFGTGFASITQLKELPVTGIKIDKSFVDTIEKDYKNTQIVRAMVSLGRQLGLKVIVEGVENNSQFELIKSFEPSAIQGNYTSKPLSAEEVLALLNQSY